MLTAWNIGSRFRHPYCRMPSQTSFFLVFGAVHWQTQHIKGPGNTHPVTPERRSFYQPWLCSVKNLVTLKLVNLKTFWPTLSQSARHSCGTQAQPSTRCVYSCCTADVQRVTSKLNAKVAHWRLNYANVYLYTDLYHCKTNVCNYP